MVILEQTISYHYHQVSFQLSVLHPLGRMHKRTQETTRKPPTSGFSITYYAALETRHFTLIRQFQSISLVQRFIVPILLLFCFHFFQQGYQSLAFIVSILIQPHCTRVEILRYLMIRPFCPVFEITFFCGRESDRWPSRPWSTQVA